MPDQFDPIYPSFSVSHCVLRLVGLAVATDDAVWRFISGVIDLSVAVFSPAYATTADEVSLFEDPASSS